MRGGSSQVVMAGSIHDIGSLLLARRRRAPLACEMVIPLLRMFSAVLLGTALVVGLSAARLLAVFPGVLGIPFATLFVLLSATQKNWPDPPLELDELAAEGAERREEIRAARMASETAARVAARREARRMATTTVTGGARFACANCSVLTGVDELVTTTTGSRICPECSADDPSRPPFTS